VFIPAYAAACGKGQVSYESQGSGAGKRAHIDRLTAFGMSDEPLSTDEMLRGILDIGSDTANPNPQGRVSPMHHIPLALGAITVSYNLGSCGIGHEALKLRSPQVAAIYTGLITNWSDPTLTLENPALAGCNKAIRPAARSDGSGTTYAFKDYLSKRNPHFNVYKSNDLNTNWPVEDLGTNSLLRGNGNGGVAAAVKANDGAIGYVELSTAINNGLTWALVDGATGVFNSPRAGFGRQLRPGRHRCHAPGVHAVSGLGHGLDHRLSQPLAYAVCTFTYALVYNNLDSAFGGALGAAQRQTLVDYLGVAVDDIGQSQLPLKGYAQIGPSMQAVAKAGLASIASL
jgi:ABC-type phosphate transport system substrate-binding protein